MCNFVDSFLDFSSLLIFVTKCYLFQVGNSVKTTDSFSQYVDLGDLSAACITIPETCGPEGAAISFWFKLGSCGVNTGLISSATNGGTYETGFSVSCRFSELTY